MSLPERMRVARLHAWGDVRVEEMQVPRPAPREALVRIDACGVCGSDALTWYVERKAAAEPVVLGHEPAGVVVALGDEVNGLRLGDRVFIHHHAPCLACDECRRGLWSSCATWRSSRILPGGFAEYALVPASNVRSDTLVLPPGLDLEAATFIEPLACCIRAVRRQGRIEPGDTTLVVGLGAMGLLMTQVARACGAGRVVGSDFIEERRSMGLEHCCDAAVAPEEVGGALAASDSGRGADVVVVCPGTPEAISAGLDAAAPGGRVVCFTPLPPDLPLTLDQSDLYFREVSLTQSYSCGPDETRDALALLADGRIRTERLISHRVGLEGVAAALERAAGKGEGIKTLVYPGLRNEG